MKKEEKICKDCKFCKNETYEFTGTEYFSCAHPKIFRRYPSSVNIISGEITSERVHYPSCEVERARDDFFILRMLGIRVYPCGKKGRLFEPKENPKDFTQPKSLSGFYRKS